MLTRNFLSFDPIHPKFLPFHLQFVKGWISPAILRGFMETASWRQRERNERLDWQKSLDKMKQLWIYHQIIKSSRKSTWLIQFTKIYHQIIKKIYMVRLIHYTKFLEGHQSLLPSNTRSHRFQWKPMMLWSTGPAENGSGLFSLFLTLL